jgi:hypothetical protein
VFSLTNDGLLKHSQTVFLQGNPLDTIVDNEAGRIFVSMGFINLSHTSSEHEGLLKVGSHRLQTIHLQGTRWIKGGLTFETQRTCQNSSARESEESLGHLSNLLYRVESLRKRGGED